MLANVAGEIVGFGAAGALMAVASDLVTSAAGLRQLGLMAGATVLMGVLEGSAVGLAQWLVLRRIFTHLTRGGWLAATVAGGTLAWGVGMALGTGAGDWLGNVDATAVPQWVSLLAGAVIGVIAGALLSVVQWLALRRHARNVGWWVPAHALGWAAGMVIAFWGMDVAAATGSIAVQIAGGAIIGLAMGAAAAAVTGLALIRVVPSPER